MDNLLEIIIPVIIAAIYFFGNLFSKGGDSDDATPSWRPAEQDPDVAAREREIRENLRRKIMERRQQSQGSDAAPAAQPVNESDREADAPARPQSPPPVPQPAASEQGGFSWDASDNAYETNMQAQLARIEATKRQAARLQSQAAASTSQVKQEWGHSEPRKRSKARLTGSVRSSLKTPSAARSAFIYGEVLGRPVSLQKSSTVPGLDR